MIKKFCSFLLLTFLGIFLLPNQLEYHVDSPTMECCDSHNKENSCCDESKDNHHNSSDHSNNCSRNCINCHLQIVPFVLILNKEYKISQKPIVKDNQISSFYLNFSPQSPLQEIWQPPKIG